MSILWWEKTVEYYFIQKHVDLSTFVAPLDGNHEKAGDAIFANVSSWVLIEFKRDIKSINDELDKFTNYDDAKRELESMGKHHLIIYGEPCGEDISLISQEYFSGIKVPVEKVLSSGISKADFVAYLKRFVAHKKNSEGGTGSFGLVAGVSNDGKVSKCMKLSEFGEAINLEQKLQRKLEQSQEPGPSHSSSGPRM